MRSYPRNPRKVEKGLDVCQRCKVALIKVEKEGSELKQCPICKAEDDGR